MILQYMHLNLSKLIIIESCIELEASVLYLYDVVVICSLTLPVVAVRATSSYMVYGIMV